MKNLTDTNISVMFVNPVKRVSAQGRHKQVYSYINSAGQLIPVKGMDKTKEFGVELQLSFPYDEFNRKLITSLEGLVFNPLKGEDPKAVLSRYNLGPSWNSIIETLVTSDKIKEQHLYEIWAGVDYDTYTSNVKYSLFNKPFGLKDYPEPTFLQTFYVTLYPKPNRFTDETPRGRLAMKLLKLHRKVANSLNEVNTAIHDYYISEENESEKIQNQKDKIIDEAVYNLFKLKREYNRYQIYKVASILTTNYGQPIINGTVSDEVIERELNKYIKDSKEHQFDNIDKFMNLINLSETVEGSEKIHIMYFIQQALNNNVIAIRDGYYVWHSQVSVPNMYKFSDYEKLVNRLLEEYRTYNEETDVTNYYGILKKELLAKGVWIEE